MPTIISGNKGFDGIFRAIVIEPTDSPTNEKNSEVKQKSCRIYIPALHREQMPFKLSESGEIQGCIFDSSENEDYNETDEQQNKKNKDTNNSLLMKKRDYPIAQVCSWGVCPQFKLGEQVWVMFENGDSEFPVVIGDLASTLSLASEPVATSSGGGIYVGSGTTKNQNADYIFFEAIKAGASIAGGCGILANVEKESEFSTELNSGDGGLASGICQWHPDRWAECESHCAYEGLDPKTIEGQTSFLLKELKSYTDLWHLICTASQTEQGAYDSGYKFCYDFERPLNKEVKSDERGKLAKNKYFSIFGGGKIENNTYVSGSTIDLAGLKINQKISSYNHSKGNISRIKYIVIHYTGNDGDSASGNANFFSNELFPPRSAHYFVDETSIYQVVKDEDIAWHCGDGKGKSACNNDNSIGIEMCSRKRNGQFYIPSETVKNTAKLTKALMQKYNIGIQNILRHYDVSGKYCPEPFVKNILEWNNFKFLVTTLS